MKKNKILFARKKKIRRGTVIIWITILIIIGLVWTFDRLNKIYTPILLETAEMEVNKLSTVIINKAISKVLENKINPNEIFSTVIDKNGNVQTVDFNPLIVNQVLNIATTAVQDNLRKLEKGNFEDIGIYDIHLSENTISKIKKGIITEIPTGVVFKNSMLSNIGPKIPIKLHYLGDINSNIKTKVTPYGINNALIEVSIHLEMTAQIILPFIVKKTQLECDIPLAIKMIQGTTPNYYGNGLLKDSSIYSIPFE